MHGMLQHYSIADIPKLCSAEHHVSCESSAPQRHWKEK